MGYGPDQITFVRSGRPLYVDDPTSRQLKFAVHPFLFDLLCHTAAAAAAAVNNRPPPPPPPPVLNWENVAAQFVAPTSLAELQTVPQLEETLHRVLLCSEEQEAALQALMQDRQHGAAELAHWVLNALESEIERTVPEKVDEKGGSGAAVLERLRNFGYHLATVRPNMAPVANTAASVLSLIHRQLHSRADPFGVTVDAVCAAGLQSISEVRQKHTASSAALLHQVHAQKLFKNDMTTTTTIMTISKSSSVLSAVLDAVKGGKKIKAFVCESRPLCEGVAVAEVWAAAGAEVVQITEAQAAVFMPEVDVVLIGADAVDNEGVHNKVGSRMLALVARAVNIPFYVLADSSKLSVGPLEALAHPGRVLQTGGDFGEEMAAEEVVKGWPTSSVGEREDVVVRNVYFEAIPLELVTAVITENGVLTDAVGISAQIERLKEVYNEAFQLCE